MKMLNTYPPAKKQKLARSKINEWAKWPFLLAIYILPIVNVMTGLPAWSVVALWSLWIVWTMLFSPQLVEYNRISNVVKLITNVAILLVLIDLLLSPGWAIEVVALVGFGGLVILSILFFSNLQKQRQNLFPLLLFIFVTIALSITGLIIWRRDAHWSIIVLATTGGAFLLTTGIVLRKDLINEFAKRFHIK